MADNDTEFGQQWAGPGKYVIYDSEDTTDTRIVKLSTLFRDGKFDEAMDLYWSFRPFT